MRFLLRNVKELPDMITYHKHLRYSGHELCIYMHDSAQLNSAIIENLIYYNNCYNNDVSSNVTLRFSDIYDTFLFYSEDDRYDNTFEINEMIAILSGSKSPNEYFIDYVYCTFAEYIIGVSVGLSFIKYLHNKTGIDLHDIMYNTKIHIDINNDIRDIIKQYMDDETHKISDRVNFYNSLNCYFKSTIENFLDIRYEWSK